MAQSGEKRLEDRVAVITGAGDGIGAGIARRFAAEGARVVVAEIDPANGEAVAGALHDEFGVDALFVPTDVTVEADNRAAVRAAVERWGTIDILVNNAWGGDRAGLQRVDRMPDEAMEHAWRINVMGPMWAMKEAFTPMRAAGRGRIINICSLNGVNAHMGSVHYNATKEALRTLTRTAAREWAGFGITANVICPGAKTAAASEAAIPMGRIGDPVDDIAPVAFFLASDDSVYITGNTLFADGGSHINGAVWVPDLGD